MKVGEREREREKGRRVKAERERERERETVRVSISQSGVKTEKKRTEKRIGCCMRFVRLYYGLNKIDAYFKYL